MEGLLQVFFVLIFTVLTESAIRMQRDFSYPRVENFNVYWNAPTSQCQKHGINFEQVLRKFGIIGNSGDKFRGENIIILYDPGLFPAMLKNNQGKFVERNGGIPQLGNLTLHLNAFKDAMDKVVPPNFSGVGVIDFEAWRPIFRQNWNDQVIYKKMSKDLERQYHPQWPEDRIDAYAAYHFEDASKIFMQTTLQLAKYLRPNAIWGYYAFPYCYNFREGKRPDCSELVESENDRIQWMFDESTGIYPSLYMSSKLNVDEHRKFVLGRLNEAWRMTSRTSYRNFPQVYPYIWFKYYDSSNFMSKDDMYTTLETTRKYKMGGAIIWGSSNDVSSKENCAALLKYVNEVLGPAVRRVQNNNQQDSNTQPGFNFGADEDGVGDEDEDVEDGKEVKKEEVEEVEEEEEEETGVTSGGDD